MVSDPASRVRSSEQQVHAACPLRIQPDPAGSSPQEENRRLKRAVEELSILNDLARAIGASVNLQDIMRTIIHRSFRAIHAEQGVITLVDRRSRDAMKTFVRTAVSSTQSRTSISARVSSAGCT